jgi:hypothetical protein
VSLVEILNPYIKETGNSVCFISELKDEKHLILTNKQKDTITFEVQYG